MKNFSVKQANLHELIRKFSYKEGRFILASGKESSFYIDIKNLSLHPQGASLIAEMTHQLVDLKQFGGVGGPTLGADPIATAISLKAFSCGVHLPAFIIRKEAKKYGTSRWIEGRDNLGRRLLMIEDVVTTGGSSADAIQKLRDEGFTVDTLLCVMDRQEGGAEKLALLGVKLIALTTIEEFRKSS